MQTLERGMAKRTEDQKRNDVTVRVDADLARRAKALASLRDVSLAEFLSDLLRPLIDREWDKEVGTGKPKR